jgi:hypothetical protein
VLLWLLEKGYALVMLGAVGLHGYTIITAYQLASPGLAQYAAALAAYLFPPISQAVVAYYTWQQSGSRVNGYTVWILLWLLLVLVVALLAVIERRLRSS